MESKLITSECKHYCPGYSLKKRGGGDHGTLSANPLCTDLSTCAYVCPGAAVFSVAQGWPKYLLNL